MSAWRMRKRKKRMSLSEFLSTSLKACLRGMCGLGALLRRHRGTEGTEKTLKKGLEVLRVLCASVARKWIGRSIRGGLFAPFDFALRFAQGQAQGMPWILTLFLIFGGCERAATIQFLAQVQPRLGLEEAEKIGIVSLVKIAEDKEPSFLFADRVLEVVMEELEGSRALRSRERDRKPEESSKFRPIWSDEVRWALGISWMDGSIDEVSLDTLSKRENLRAIGEKLHLDALVVIDGEVSAYLPGKVVYGHPRTPEPPPLELFGTGIYTNVQVRMDFHLFSLPSGEKVWERPLSRSFPAYVRVSLGGNPLKSGDLGRRVLRIIRGMAWDFKFYIVPHPIIVERKFALER